VTAPGIPPLDFESALAGRRVLVTGHTGFTGGWLTLWLGAIGCEVAGLALAPDTEPNLYTAAGIGDGIASTIGDIRDFATVQDAVARAEPEVVFHLAAQPLVSRGFADPIGTFATNVMGTAHVLEAARAAQSVRAVVAVTTDKVYANREQAAGYREDDPLGGNDPYGASKAAAELVAASYRAGPADRGGACLIATARGGNIIGGGDWSDDRIVPDFVRAVRSGAELVLRRPGAVRPWQHVLALAHGYLALAARLLDGQGGAAEAWNFGPGEGEEASVGELVAKLAAAWAGPTTRMADPPPFPETGVLKVDSAKARDRLGWRPPLDLSDCVGLTAEWYRGYYDDPGSARALTAAQIDRYRGML
jgi:CDP-glucose 4,6-dehydratase